MEGEIEDLEHRPHRPRRRGRSRSLPRAPRISVIPVGSPPAGVAIVPLTTSTMATSRPSSHTAARVDGRVTSRARSAGKAIKSASNGRSHERDDLTRLPDRPSRRGCRWAGHNSQGRPSARRTGNHHPTARTGGATRRRPAPRSPPGAARLPPGGPIAQVGFDDRGARPTGRSRRRPLDGRPRSDRRRGRASSA